MVSGGPPTCAKVEAKPEEALDLAQISRDHTLARGAIMNVIRYASLQALKNARHTIVNEDVLQGIRREYDKEGKKG
jgi:ATP-dependent 26S proteasome regulatory subunit